MAQTTIFKSDNAAEAVASKSRELLRHWPVEKEELDIDTRHGRTRVIACGQRDKPPLLLFHPGGSNAVYWLPQIDVYARSHRVFAIDIIGEAGESEDRRPRYKGDAYREWIEDLLAGLDIRRAAFAGASFGAWLCLSFACLEPERVERLALISPPGVIRARRSRFRLLALLSWLSGPLGRRLTFRSQLRKSGIDPKLGELLDLIHGNTRLRPLQLPRVTARELRQLHCPLLLMVGGRDAWFDTRRLVLRMVRFCPQVEINYREREGHWLGEYTREVDRFLVTHYAPD